MLTKANTFRKRPSHGMYYIKKELLKKTNNLIEFEEQVQLLMYDTFSELVGVCLVKSIRL